MNSTSPHESHEHHREAPSPRERPLGQRDGNARGGPRLPRCRPAAACRGAGDRRRQEGTHSRPHRPLPRPCNSVAVATLPRDTRGVQGDREIPLGTGTRNAEPVDRREVAPSVRPIGVAPFGAWVLASWLVSCILVSLDLATSPIHGHGHDGAWRPVVHALSAAPGTAGQVGAHYECDVPTDTAHSLIALRVRALQAAYPASGDNDVSLSPVSRIAGSVRLADLALRPDPRDARPASIAVFPQAAARRPRAPEISR